MARASARFSSFSLPAPLRHRSLAPDFEPFLARARFLTSREEGLALKSRRGRASEEEGEEAAVWTRCFGRRAYTNCGVAGSRVYIYNWPGGGF